MAGSASSFAEQFHQRAGVHHRAGELAGQVEGEHVFQGVVAQHGHVQEAGQHGFILGGLRGFLSDGEPERIAVCFVHLAKLP